MFSTIGYWICVPFAWLLLLFYNLTGSYGWALVLFTLAVKLVLLPFQLKSKRSMMRMSGIQAQLKEIQQKYANNPTKMNEEMQRLYMETGVKPMSGCLWSFLPFPILIALYSIIRQPLTHFMLVSSEMLEKVTAFASEIGYVASGGAGYEQIGLAKFISEHFDAFSAKFEGIINLDYHFLGMDLSLVPQEHWGEVTTGGWPIIGLFLMPVISAALSFMLSKASMKTAPAGDADPTARSMKMMMWMMPLMSLYIGFILPGALCVYWIANSVFSFIQEVLMNKFFSKRIAAEEEERARRIKEDRERRIAEGRERQRLDAERAAMETAKGQKKIAEKRAAKQAAKANADKKSATTEAGRVGDRPYARGRSFREDRYDG
ncbi:MAG: YidC/Oxa1 family membrane protein insertase [Oscillospiraceae bacterium]|nr:YidC/Oxa1 family membrane protein insertase [Oscillospiraceae bacterium]